MAADHKFGGQVGDMAQIAGVHGAGLFGNQAALAPTIQSLGRRREKRP